MPPVSSTFYMRKSTVSKTLSVGVAAPLVENFGKVGSHGVEIVVELRAQASGGMPHCLQQAGAQLLFLARVRQLAEFLFKDDANAGAAGVGAERPVREAVPQKVSLSLNFFPGEHCKEYSVEIFLF